ncbi:UDP-N-acetylglucosamine-dolichyl-phosphate N-acetylglucosaminephosphotransferase [Pelomyxa schiedti]|nr:UDP-N-acetylglucosamine-dolichyl-phosphate N-acetylglucosaminephosphotransferase [Pelomyxa schiedti]
MKTTWWLGVCCAMLASFFLSCTVPVRNALENTAIQTIVLCGTSVVAFVATVMLIPFVKPMCLKRGLGGKDINKNGTELIPESLGIVPGVVYLTCVILYQPFFGDKLGNFNAGLLSCCMMLLLGFSDDVLDLRWRIKIALSALATLPLLAGYTGSTYISLPTPLHSVLGITCVNLGALYYVYMLLVGVFCTNSINIYAGVNGLEVSQSVVIGCGVACYNLIEIYLEHDVGGYHRLSLFLVLPFITASLGLLWHNWYPSRVFVGDSYTYFAGMTLAVVGILGHFSKTLMLLFIPEVINFLLSVPQLIGIIPCPRHRLPKLNPETGKLGYVQQYTLINTVLYLVGPKHEHTLVIILTLFQVFCVVCALSIRYFVAPILFGTVL